MTVILMDLKIIKQCPDVNNIDESFTILKETIKLYKDSQKFM